MDANFQKEVAALKLIVAGSIIAEYGCRNLIDDTKYDLKQHVKNAFQSNLKVQNWFKFHRQGNENYKQIFTEQFNDSKFVLMAEITKELFDFTEDAMDEILSQLQAIKAQINATHKA